METLLAQAFTDYEIVVSDNCSDDGAWEFLQKFKDNPKVRLSQAPRRGMYAKWNECLQRARGRYLYMATSDDTCAPTTLEELVAPLQQRPELKIAVCGLHVINEKSEPVVFLEKTPYWQFLGEWMHTPSIRNGRSEFLLHAVFGTLWFSMTSVLFHREVLERAGYFRTDHGSHADQEWALREALASDVAFVPERLATWRFWQGQATPHRFETPAARILMEGLDTVLHDEKAGLPAEWKKVPDWDRRVMTAKRADYLASFWLWRRAAVQDPLRFLKGAWSALWREPGLLCSQALRAFAWSEGFGVDRLKLARTLLETFHSPWPPKSS